MNSHPSSDERTQQTIDYYEAHAERYCDNTQGLDMSALYERFLRHLPAGARLLDAGCGSGRDSLHFLQQGYRVIAFDAARAMVERAEALIGQPVLHLTFQNLTFNGEFDGIWACASLLHVPSTDMPDVLTRLRRALNRGGILYVSFKYGEDERVRNGRLFNDYTEESLQALIDQQSALSMVEMWRTHDVRPDRADEVWLNAILRAE